MRSITLLFLLLLTPIVRGATITLARADELLAGMKVDPWEERKDASAIAWNEAYTLDALVDLYDATGNAKYLRELVSRSDRVISHRDDKRNFADYTREAHKRWSIDSKYTLATALLVDESGKEVIRLVSTTSANNHITSISVLRSGDRFTLKVANSAWKRAEVFKDLSTDPADARYFAKVLNDPTPLPKPPAGSSGAHSQLVRAELIDKDARIAPPKEQRFKLTPMWDSHVGYVGIIYYPMLKLAMRVKDDPKLAEFNSAAERFVASAAESFADCIDHWRDGPNEGEGHYIGSKRGGATPFDNVCMPFNYQAKMACSEQALFQLTGREVYKNHVTSIAKLLKNRLELKTIDGVELYVWKYWFEPMTVGWEPSANLSDHYPKMAPYLVPEDASHATLEIAMVTALRDANILFDDTDLTRFAKTFLVNVVNADRTGLNGYVDGRTGNAKFESASVVGWLPLAQVDPAVYVACREIYLKRDKDDFKALARLLRWEHKLRGKP